jgi:1,4-alpha-glucan branching enzyme
VTPTVPSGVIEAIVAGRHDDPFAVLGPHEAAGGVTVRAFVPGAQSLEALSRTGERLAGLACAHPAGFFEGRLSAKVPYRLHARRGADEWLVDDPYA